MDAIKFLKEKNRMTNYCTVECNECLINDLSKQKGIYCVDLEKECPEELLEIVEQWSKENPAKTYKNDFLKKFPKTAYPEENLHKHNRWCDLYNYGHCDKGDSISCDKCWDMEMEL